MTLLFEELDYQETPLGGISLRRRADPRLEGLVIYEVKLGDDFLMSSLFTDAEIQLARLALAGFNGDVALDVVVGGLGLGYTAAAALQDTAVRSLQVIELMAPVIDWHRRQLVPLGRELTTDTRCTLVQADFFARAMAADCGFYSAEPAKQPHAVLLDIDHSPAHWLDRQNSSFYTRAGLQSVAQKIVPGGVFGLWSNDPPDTGFKALLESVFARAESQVIRFRNPYTGGEAANTVYLGHNN